ncbi:hypothetical protein LR48_Vigan349s000900 [Vigna angularis]|uniref:Uncharacterized protein n=1 Tax=Phaseolus angularis TaxID=3914 RepID=A0A0L9T8R4_PHAAN|nr:hypothetical protein LR48_Vigan349s000900 [Vigna angularis]
MESEFEEEESRELSLHQGGGFPLSAAPLSSPCTSAGMVKLDRELPLDVSVCCIEERCHSVFASLLAFNVFLWTCWTSFYCWDREASPSPSWTCRACWTV